MQSGEFKTSRVSQAPNDSAPNAGVLWERRQLLPRSLAPKSFEEFVTEVH